MKALTQYRTECQYGEANWEEYDTFLQYERTAHDELYIRNYLVGRFIQVEDLADDRDLAELITSIEDVPVEYMSCNCILVGGLALIYSLNSKLCYVSFDRHANIFPNSHFHLCLF